MKVRNSAVVIRRRSTYLFEEGLAPYPPRPRIGVTNGVARDVLENLATCVVVAEWLWGEAETLRSDMTKQCVDGGGPRAGRATNRVTNPDDPIQLSAGKCHFRIAHPLIIPYEDQKLRSETVDPHLGVLGQRSSGRKE